MQLIAVAGAPYDTMEEVIGLRGKKGQGSLKELGVSYREVQVESISHLSHMTLISTSAPNLSFTNVSRELTNPSSQLSFALVRW